MQSGKLKECLFSLRFQILLILLCSALILNNWFLKVYHPSVLTGKISDLAGVLIMFVFLKWFFDEVGRRSFGYDLLCASLSMTYLFSIKCIDQATFLHTYFVKNFAILIDVDIAGWRLYQDKTDLIVGLIFLPILIFSWSAATSVDRIRTSHKKQ